MQFIKNPILFLKEVEKVLINLRRVQERYKTEQQADYVSILFPTKCTVSTKRYSKIPYLKSFLLLKSTQPEPLEGTIVNTVISYEDLVLFSLDNKDYFYFSNEIKDSNEYLYNEIIANKDNHEFFFYICDITRSFYTKVDFSNMCILDKLKKAISVEETDDIRNIKVFYHSCAFVYYLVDSEEYIKPFDQIDDFTIFCFDGDDIDDIYNLCYFNNIKNEIYNVNDNFRGYEKEEALILDVNQYESKTQKLVRDNFVPSITIFDKKIQFTDVTDSPISSFEDYKDKILSLVPYIHTLNNTINCYKLNNNEPRKRLYNTLSDTYQILVEKSIEDDLNINEVLENVFNALCLYSIYCENRLIPDIGISFLSSPHLYSLFYFWSRISKNLSRDVIFTYTPQRLEEAVSELFSTSYFNQFFSELQNLSDDIQQTQEDIDNFQGGFVGGGFGIRGATKGLLTAALANAITETAFTIHKIRKIDTKKAEQYIAEFLKTDQSKKYIRDLMVLDIKYLLMKSLEMFFQAGSNNEYNVSFAEAISVHKYKGFFDNFVKSAKIYSIALAKYYNLAMIPEYEGFDEYYKMLPKDLLEEALLSFPYDELYYRKYMDFGGIITDELKCFAAMNMVDLEPLCKKQAERIRIQKELEEKQKKIDEEKKRKEQEERELALKKMVELFGFLANEYSNLYLMLSENPIYKEYAHKQFSSHNEIVDVVFDYLSNHYKNISTSFYPVSSKEFTQKSRNLQNVHGYSNITNENTLFIYDDTVFGSAKDGFVITKNCIYFRNILESPVAIPIKEIKELKATNDSILINGKRIGLSLCKLDKKVVVHIFDFCICELLSINDKTIEKSDVGSSAEDKSKDLWECVCGEKNEYAYKFCPYCGQKRIELKSEWICKSCGKKNSSDSKFCGKCGNKRE